MRPPVSPPRPAARGQTRRPPILASILLAATVLGVLLVGAGGVIRLPLLPDVISHLQLDPGSWQSAGAVGRRGGDATFPSGVPQQPGLLCTQESRNAAGRSVTVDTTERICGDVTVYAGSADILGEVDGDVTVVGGSATIAGDVLGNVTTVGGSITIASQGQVHGNVHALGGQVTRAEGSYVGGRVERDLSAGSIAPPQWFGFDERYSFPWLSLLLWSAVGALLVAFFPEQIGRVRSIARRDFPKSVVAGALAAIVGGLLAIFLFVTCLGIPIAVLLVAGLWVAWVVGTVALGFLLGDLLLNGRASSGRSPVAATVLGLALIALAESIPCLGGVVSLVVGAAGLGAALLALLNARRSGYHRWRTY